MQQQLNNEQNPMFTCNGIALDMSPDAFGELEPSNEFSTDPASLCNRLEEQAYLLIKGF